MDGKKQTKTDGETQEEVAAVARHSGRPAAARSGTPLFDKLFYPRIFEEFPAPGFFTFTLLTAESSPCKPEWASLPGGSSATAHVIFQYYTHIRANTRTHTHSPPAGSTLSGFDTQTRLRDYAKLD